MRALLALALVVTGATGPPRTIERGGLELRVPADWQEKASAREVAGALTLTLGPSRAGASELLVSVLSARKHVDTRALVETQGRKLLASAVEPTLAVLELRGECARGHYYALTDRAPAPGEFEHMLQGVLTCGTRLVSFTLLSHAVDAGERDSVLEALRGACPARGEPR